MEEFLSQFCAQAPAITVRGDILTKWQSLGGERGALGYPVSPEAALREGGSAMRFQCGVVYAHPKLGAYALFGKFQRCYEDAMGIYGRYGYPTSDARAENIVVDGGRDVLIHRQSFQRGEISDYTPAVRNGSDLRGEIARRGIAIRNQGKRGTCSIQAMVFLMEYQLSGLLGTEYNHLSVEYANHFANVASGRDDDGDYFSSVALGYDAFGIVRACDWAYDADFEYTLPEAAARVTPEVIARGQGMLAAGLRLRGRFLKEIGGVGLTDGQFASLLDCLDRGVPVAVGRDHSMVAVAYERDRTLAGGGLIVLRNSYGQSSWFPGYQIETFEHLQRTVFDLYVYETDTDATRAPLCALG